MGPIQPRHVNAFVTACEQASSALQKIAKAAEDASKAFTAYVAFYGAQPTLDPLRVARDDAIDLPSVQGPC